MQFSKYSPVQCTNLSIIKYEDIKSSHFFKKKINIIPFFLS